MIDGEKKVATPRKRKAVPPPSDVSKAEDAKAQAEADEIAAGNLGKQKKLAAFRRAEAFKDAIAQGIHVLFWFGLSAVLLSGLVWLYHLVTPDCMHFLTEKEVDKISTLLFGGALVTFVSDYAKAQLK